jgi:hypothetical protein
VPSARRAARRRGGAGNDGENRPERWLSLVGNVVAPTTAITALMFYFGFVDTDSFYEYFGVDAATLNFSTEDYLLRSIGALYIPLGAILVVLLLVSWLNAKLAEWISARRHLERIHRAASGVAAAGSTIFLVGILGILQPFGWTPGPMVTPICLGIGVAAVTYGRYLFRRSVPRRPRGLGSGERTGLGILVALMVLSVFWVTNTYAIEHGQRQAKVLAGQLDVRPAVTLDTSERLVYHFPGTEETALPVSSPDQKFRYRYRGLRLLAQSGDRMFLLPDGWTPHEGDVLMLEAGPTIRVRFHPG